MGRYSNPRVKIRLDRLDLDHPTSALLLLSGTAWKIGCAGQLDRHLDSSQTER